MSIRDEVPLSCVSRGGVRARRTSTTEFKARLRCGLAGRRPPRRSPQRRNDLLLVTCSGTNDRFASRSCRRRRGQSASYGDGPGTGQSCYPLGDPFTETMNEPRRRAWFTYKLLCPSTSICNYCHEPRVTHQAK